MKERASVTLANDPSRLGEVGWRSHVAGRPPRSLELVACGTAVARGSVHPWMLDHHEFWVTDQSNDRGTGSLDSLVSRVRLMVIIHAEHYNNAEQQRFLELLNRQTNSA